MNNAFGMETQLAASVQELRAVHFELARLMDEIDAVVREPHLDEVRLSSIRWKLSQARRQSRLIVDEILAGLPAELRAGLDKEIARLTSLANDALFATARHSGRWNARAVHDDPNGYRLAIRHLRGLWFDIIETEQRLLYPLPDWRPAAAA